MSLGVISLLRLLLTAHLVYIHSQCKEHQLSSAPTHTTVSNIRVSPSRRRLFSFGLVTVCCLTTFSSTWRGGEKKEQLCLSILNQEYLRGTNYRMANRHQLLTENSWIFTKFAVKLNLKFEAASTWRASFLLDNQVEALLPVNNTESDMNTVKPLRLVKSNFFQIQIKRKGGKDKSRAPPTCLCISMFSPYDIS